MTKEGFFVNYIKQIERSDSHLFDYSAVQINSRSIGSLGTEVYLTPYFNGIE